MDALKIFTHESFGSVRAVERGGQPWFAAKDVAQALGYTSTNMATVFQAVPAEWKGSNPIATPGGTQELLMVAEPGLYFFLGRSDKPGALPFQKWLAGEVLPSIRRHGVYATPQTVEAMLNDPETTIKILTALKEERAQRHALEARAEVDRPKVVFADSIEVSRSTILVGELAKLVKQSTGHDIGQRRMFDWLRDNGFLHKRGSDRNMPTQKSMDMGLIVIKEGSRIGSSGESHLTKTPKITGKGQIYFINTFNSKAARPHGCPR